MTSEQTNHGENSFLWNVLLDNSLDVSVKPIKEEEHYGNDSNKEGLSTDPGHVDDLEHCLDVPTSERSLPSGTFNELMHLKTGFAVQKLPEVLFFGRLWS